MSDNNPMSKIEHVVYCMFENRSFDNVLGWLYDAEADPEKLGLNIIAKEADKDKPFEGLIHGKYSNVSLDGKRIDVQRGIPSARKGKLHKRSKKQWDIPAPDPHEEFAHVNIQLFYPHLTKPCCGEKETSEFLPGPALQPTMGGFLADYETVKQFYKFGPTIDPTDAQEQIMHMYAPEELSVLNTLAREYAVSDHWFSSVPTQTTPNRGFSICGQSDGQVNNHGAFFGLVPTRFKAKSIWKVLYDYDNRKDLDWKIYHQHLYPSWCRDKGLEFYSYTRDAFDVGLWAPETQFAHISEFFDAAKSGSLPSFSYIEPDWAGLIDIAGVKTFMPNSYHPPSEVGPGEQFLKDLFDAVASSPKWNETLLIITFDEHGGTYDHVPPPAAIPPNDELVPMPECGFGFDRFGVRVPAILVSPYIKRNTVFRSETDIPYDHTSVLATILDWKGIPKDLMGNRVKNAPTFENVLGEECRKELPLLEVHAELRGKFDPGEALISDLQAFVLPRMIHQLGQGKMAPDEAEAEAEKILKDVSTFADMHQRLGSVARRLLGTG